MTAVTSRAGRSATALAHPVWRALAGRAIQGAVVVFAVATLSFVLIHLAPGDPLSAASENPLVTEAIRAQWRANWGLDRPLPEQYARYLASLVRGDFGYSFSMHEPVAHTLARALPQTVLLMGVSLVLSFAIGIFLGTRQAMRPGGLLDRAIDALSLPLYSVPEFWLALTVMLSLAYWVPLFPVGGAVDPVMHDYMTPAGRLVDRLRHIALPALTLTLPFAAAMRQRSRYASTSDAPISSRKSDG